MTEETEMLWACPYSKHFYDCPHCDKTHEVEHDGYSIMLVTRCPETREKVFVSYEERPFGL